MRCCCARMQRVAPSVWTTCHLFLPAWFMPSFSCRAPACLPVQPLLPALPASCRCRLPACLPPPATAFACRYAAFPAASSPSLPLRAPYMPLPLPPLLPAAPACCCLALPYPACTALPFCCPAYLLCLHHTLHTTATCYTSPHLPSAFCACTHHTALPTTATLPCHTTPSHTIPPPHLLYPIPLHLLPCHTCHTPPCLPLPTLLHHTLPTCPPHLHCHTFP